MGKSVSSSGDPTDEETHSDPLTSPLLQNSTSTSPTYDTSKLFAPALGSTKKKSISRPKQNMRTTTSTFVTRLQSIDGLSRYLQSKQTDVTFLFYNCAKNFFWAELGSKTKEPINRITFSAYPTCHAVNLMTASPEALDIVIGFHTGDLIWLEPVSGRYARLNKQGCICNSPCTSVKWVPNSPTLFLVSHADGTIIVYDKERDDGSFTPREPEARASTRTNGQANGSGSSSSIPSDGSDSQRDWNPLDSIFVTMPKWHPVTNIHLGRSAKSESFKNPVTHWRVSKRSIVDISFSHDGKYLAVVAEDGCLRIIDAFAEQLLDCYASYFGSFTCCAWSPDSQFLITGGQDDLVTIFSPVDQRVVARCQGHSSFVSSVCFDPERTDERTYRFGSVGEDNKLILWDFSSGALHRPKLMPSYQQRLSISSSLSLALKRRPDAAEGSTLHLPPALLAEEDGISRYHGAPSRNEVAVVQPVVVKHIEGDLLTAVSFSSNSVLTASKGGHSKCWLRPLEVHPHPSRQKLRNPGSPNSPQ